MEEPVVTFEFILLMTAAVLVSSVIDQVLPKVSPPLIQIGLGLLIALLATTPISVTLEPDFFLVLFIAPLLFNDAKESDKLGLWRNRATILSLAIGLVLAIVFVVGFTVHALVPSIPLAAAFALGAALGPTDAVAVTSLTSAAELDRREGALLSGEALLNDASGVVSFQFAIAAAVTGAFSLLDASASFVVSFIGGIALGLILALLAHFLQQKMRGFGLESITFHVMFELLLPFIIYMICEAIHVSGILAVVTAGIVLSRFNERTIGPTNSRLNIVSSSVWKVLAFTLNGIVFVMLGMQLPNAMSSSLVDPSFHNDTLIIYVLIITAVLVTVRFLWVFVMDRVSHRVSCSNGSRTLRRSVKTALISTAGGPKGAVTLSIIFSIPLLTDAGTAFPRRDLMIFLASGVILCTLLIANFALPALAPKPVRVHDDDKPEVAYKKIEIMRHVISELLAAKNEQNTRATRDVIHAYNDRIARIRSLADMDDDRTTGLRIDVLCHQREMLVGKIENGTIDEAAAVHQIRRLTRTRNLLEHRHGVSWSVTAALSHMPSTLRVGARKIGGVLTRLSSAPTEDTALDVMHTSEDYAVRYLQEMLVSEGRPYADDIIEEVLASHMASLQQIVSMRADAVRHQRENESMAVVQRYAYHVELEEIQRQFDSGAISRSLASQMRDNVYLMLVDLETE